MNKTFKRFSAAFMALTMSVSLATSCTKAPDNKENTSATTSAASTETEAPKESETTTTEAPKESETTVVETTKAPSAFFAKYTLCGGPFQAGRQIDASIDEKGILKWKNMIPDPQSVDDPEEYSLSYNVYISGACVRCIDFNESKAGKEYKINLKKDIDDAIKEGSLKKSANNKYPVLLIAEGSDYWETYASWSGEITYASKAKAGKMGKISASIDENSNLSWTGLKRADRYEIYINEYYVYVGEEPKKFSLNKQIDFMIKAGFIKNTDTYNIRMVAYDTVNEKYIAQWETTYKYASNAVPGGNLAAIKNLTIKDGVMTWDAVEGADRYYIEIFIGGKRVDEYYADKNKTDINNYIATELDKDLDPENADFSFRVSAVEMSASVSVGLFESEKLAIAVGYLEDYKLTKAPNPLSVTGKEATVNSSKLKSKKQTIKASKLFDGLSSGRGGFVFTKLSGDKNISINKSSGKVTIKKNGLKKGGTYEVKVSVKAKGNIGYEPSEVKEVTFTIKVT